MKKITVLFLLFLLALCGCASATNHTADSTTDPQVHLPNPTQDTEPEVPPTDPVFDPYALIGQMSNEALVGQIFLARCPDVNAAEDVSSYSLGGYVLFARDFRGKTREEVLQAIDSYQQAAGIPLLIAVDEEGGIVNRVSSQPQFRDAKFPSPRIIYQDGGLPLLLETEKEKCELLASLGINVNLAPVCDITTNKNAFMYSRSLGQSPEITGQYIAQTVRYYNSQQMGCVLKHFPGYGNSEDTHVGIAVDSRSLALLESNDLIPFSEGIKAGASAIMISHVIIEALDPQMPATLSQPVHNYLRTNMGFTGVIITDDLVMQAITDLYGADEAAVLAVEAGNDLLIASEYAVQYQAVLEALRSGRISRKVLEDSVARILQWKYDLGLLPIVE